DAGDTRALWTWAALEVLWYTNDFGLLAWDRLHSLGRLRVADVIQAALCLSTTCGPNVECALVDFLLGKGLRAEAEAVLAVLLRSSDPIVVTWAEGVRDGIRHVN